MAYFIAFITCLAIAHASFSCSVNEGQDITLVSDTYECPTIMIEGTLRVKSKTDIIADRIEVAVGGKLFIGTSDSPAEDVTVTLNHKMGYNHVTGSGTITSAGQLMSYGETYIYGKPKTSWTLLNKDCDSCTQIQVDECLNWSVGDTIGVVTTGNGATSYSSSVEDNRSEKRVISSIDTANCIISVDSAFNLYHRGTWLNGMVPTRAEVVNLDRSILITGPTYAYSSDPLYGFQGIVTRQAGDKGVMQVENTRIENCGRVELGEYCLHFHYAGLCPDCIFRGNAIENSNNKALTVHSTHHSLVDNNVAWQNRGAFLYIEDGNEYENIISNNVFVCPDLNKGENGYPCKLKGISNHIEADYNNQAGIYTNSASNHFIGNHITGMYNALLVGSVHGWGDGGSQNRVCVTMLPFGLMKGNIFHNMRKFGWYSISHKPNKVLTDENGHVADWKTCNLFNMETGEETAAPFIVEDHVEYLNGWGFGTYDLFDVTLRNFISALNGHGCYWKNYRRGINTEEFCDNCLFYNNDRILLPGGTGMIEFKNSKIYQTDGSTNRISLNHDCALDNGGKEGGLCASHFWFQDINDGGNGLTFSFSTGGYKPKDTLVFYDDFTYFDAENAHPTFPVSDCLLENKGELWRKCPQSMGIRIVRIYSPDRGDLRVTTSTGVYTVPFRDWKRYSGYSGYVTEVCGSTPENDCTHRVWPVGYTFLVADGEDVELEVRSYSGVFYDTFTVEYSEPQMPATSITMSVTGDSTLSGSACTISSDHSRTFISPWGPFVPQVGAWWDCKVKQDGNGWNAEIGVSDFVDDFVALWYGKTPSGSSDVSVKGAVIDSIPTPPPSARPKPSPTSSTTPRPSSTTIASCASYGCVDYVPSHDCQCNSECTRFNNCCSDYSDLCSSSTGPSCAFYGCVGYEPAHECQCNSKCVEFNNCCSDYSGLCANRRRLIQRMM